MVSWEFRGLQNGSLLLMKLEVIFFALHIGGLSFSGKAVFLPSGGSVFALDVLMVGIRK